MRIDCHTHIGPFEEDKSVTELIAMLDEHEMDMALTFPGRALRGSPRVYRQGNDYVAQAAQEHPDRLVPVCTVNPWHGDEAWVEMERAITELGCKGLKLHPPTQGFDVYNLDLMAPLMERAQSFGIFVIIHGGIRVHDNPLRFVLLSQAYPDVKLVMLHANFGGTDRVAIEWAAKQTENLFFETSATSEPAFLAKLTAWSDDRVFYGSDWPWLPPRLEVAMVEHSGLDADAQAGVLGDNAARLLLGMAE